MKRAHHCLRLSALQFLFMGLFLHAPQVQAARTATTTYLSAESAEWTGSGGLDGGAGVELRLINLSNMRQTVRLKVLDEAVESDVSLPFPAPWTFSGAWSHYTKNFSRSATTDPDGFEFHEKIVLDPAGSAGASKIIKLRANCDWCTNSVTCDTSLVDTTPACAGSFPVTGKHVKYSARYIVSVLEDRGAILASLWIVAGIGAALHQNQDRYLHQLNGGRPF